MSINKSEIVAVVTTEVPESYKNPPVPAVSIFIRGVERPFLITYEDVKARDQGFESVLKELATE